MRVGSAEGWEESKRKEKKVSENNEGKNDVRNWKNRKKNTRGKDGEYKKNRRRRDRHYK